MKTLLKKLMILILFIPSTSLVAQYPAIKKLNKDTVSIFNTDNTKTLAKICKDRDYLINVKYTYDTLFTNYNSIINNNNIQIKNLVSICNYKDSINNNLKSEINILNDVIVENEKVISNKNKSLWIHKAIIVVLGITLLIK